MCCPSVCEILMNRLYYTLLVCLWPLKHIHKNPPTFLKLLYNLVAEHIWYCESLIDYFTASLCEYKLTMQAAFWQVQTSHVKNTPRREWRLGISKASMNQSLSVIYQKLEEICQSVCHLNPLGKNQHGTISRFKIKLKQLPPLLIKLTDTEKLHRLFIFLHSDDQHLWK